MQNEEQDSNKQHLDSLLCPSFNSYCTDQLVSIADQVSRDYNRAQNDNAFNSRQNDDTNFEFVAFREAVEDGVFFNDGVFPLFNRDLLRDHGSIDSTVAALGRSEHDPPPPPSESSSEADDLEGVPAGTFCLWIPNSPQASPSRCKKSNSTGSSSSKRWKLLDLLRRSNSEGKESFVFLTPSSAKNKAKETWSSGSIEVAGKPKSKGFAGGGGEKKVSPPVSAHEALYVRNRELRRVDKKRSYLPYKPNLVGFCTSRLGKAFPSF